MGNDIWMPRIAQDICNGCGACIVECPADALGWKDGKGALVYPTRCVYCATCEYICPVNAIELPYLVVKRDSSIEESS